MSVISSSDEKRIKQISMEIRFSALYCEKQRLSKYITPINSVPFNHMSIWVISQIIYEESLPQCSSLITKTSPCNEHPLTPHFYIVKLGFTGVYFVFLFLLRNIDCGYSLEPPQ